MWWLCGLSPSTNNCVYLFSPDIDVAWLFFLPMPHHAILLFRPISYPTTKTSASPIHTRPLHVYSGPLLSTYKNSPLHLTDITICYSILCVVTLLPSSKYTCTVHKSGSSSPGTDPGIRKNRAGSPLYVPPTYTQKRNRRSQIAVGTKQ